uniref:Hydroxyisourate hydrolase isoform X2 n=1 Tax=Rhizophora mucronata TaxID=61149 RepID=A0A2P2PW18_RHIMU
MHRHTHTREKEDKLLLIKQARNTARKDVEAFLRADCFAVKLGSVLY